MPEPLTTKIDNWRITYSYIWSDLRNLYNYLNYTADQIRAENFSGAADMLEMCANHTNAIAGHFKGGSPNLYSTMYYAMDWIDDNWPTVGEEYELTMSKILDALWDAKPHQCLLFIPMIDAMRGSIMEKTVTLDYMARALRHFQE